MKTRDIEFYLQAAEQLGIDYPGREPADLQGFLRVMWTLLTSEQQQDFADSSDVRDTLQASLVVDDDGDGDGDGVRDRKTGELLSWLDVESYIEAAKQHGDDSEPDMNQATCRIISARCGNGSLQSSEPRSGNPLKCAIGSREPASVQR